MNQKCRILQHLGATNMCEICFFNVCIGKGEHAPNMTLLQNAPAVDVQIMLCLDFVPQ